MKSELVSPQAEGIGAFIAGFEAGDKVFDLYEAVYLDDKKINGDDLTDVITKGPAAATSLIAFVNQAKNIGKEFDDLSDSELAELKSRFGSKVDDPNFQLLFNSLLGAAVAIDRIAEGTKKDDPTKGK